jgi:(p)ppGpp synthase/HD superfamily hydrolase
MREGTEADTDRHPEYGRFQLDSRATTLSPLNCLIAFNSAGNVMPTLFSPSLERALRFAARRHRHQNRKASDIPYITHPVHVLRILESAGFEDEALLASALLHDVIEDCGVTRDELSEQFNPEIAALVAAVSEQKVDAQGRARSWEDRKRQHLAELADAPLEVQALTLADKLHNLETIALDLAAGTDVWDRFNAPRDRLLWYYEAVIDACIADDPRVQRLAASCRDVLRRLAAAG